MSETLSQASDPMQLAVSAARDGANDAYEAASRAWESSSLFLSRFMYTTCYTISYGVVFPATFLALSIPKDNAAVRGLIEGAQSAREQIDKLRGETHEEPAATATS